MMNKHTIWTINVLNMIAKFKNNIEKLGGVEGWGEMQTTVI